MKALTFFLFFWGSICSTFSLSAQGENNTWCFGHRTGLDFNGTTPVFFEHDMEVIEGSASVSDTAGNLLFYTSGSKVWDRNHNLMPNGSGLPGNTFSSMNGVAIVPAVGAPGKYYIITTDEEESGMDNAYYSVVDMNLNGGFGDIVAGQSGILLDSNLREGVVVTTMPDCRGYWIMLKPFISNQYHAFSITSAGINTTPVISTSTNVVSGFMRFSNSGNRIVTLSLDFIETAVFNQATGLLSDFQFINFPGISLQYAFFSPNDERLYLSTTGELAQIDMSLLPDTAAVHNHIHLFSQGPIMGSGWGRTIKYTYY